MKRHQEKLSANWNTWVASRNYQACQHVGFQMVTGFLQAPPERILKNQLSMESGMLNLVSRPLCHLSSFFQFSLQCRAETTKHQGRCWPVDRFDCGFRQSTLGLSKVFGLKPLHPPLHPSLHPLVGQPIQVLGIRVPCHRSTTNSFLGGIVGSVEVLSLKGVLKCSTKSRLLIIKSSSSSWVL